MIIVLSGRGREREREWKRKRQTIGKKRIFLCKEQTCLLETTLRATVKNTYKCVEIIQRFRGCIDKIFGFGSFGFGCFTFRGIVSPRTPRIYDSLFFFFLPPSLLDCKKQRDVSAFFPPFLLLCRLCGNYRPSSKT